MAKTGKNLQTAIQYLDKSELVAIPTETVYGLAANALNPEAATKIFEAKKRPAFDPLIIHTNAIEKVQNWVSHIPGQALLLAQTFWPGPLTLVLPKQPIIPDIVTSGMPSVAVRIPRHPLTLKLLAELPYPLAAPSANPFGFVSPTCAQHVEDQLGEVIPYILDGGPCEVGLESTIISFTGDTPCILRWGGTGREEIEAIIGPVEVQGHSSSNPQAPGQLKSHYAPKIPLVQGDIEQLLDQHEGKRIGLITFSKDFHHPDVQHKRVLSPTGSMQEAAQKLFAALRFFDASKTDIIITEYFPDHGLGKAINDRLKRAAAA